MGEMSARITSKLTKKRATLHLPQPVKNSNTAVLLIIRLIHIPWETISTIFLPFFLKGPIFICLDTVIDEESFNKEYWPKLENAIRIILSRDLGQPFNLSCEDLYR